MMDSSELKDQQDRNSWERRHRIRSRCNSGYRLTKSFEMIHVLDRAPPYLPSLADYLPFTVHLFHDSGDG